MITVVLVIFSANLIAQSIDQLLKRSIAKINTIQCINYKSISGSSAPNDSVLMNQYSAFNKMMVDPNDSLIGARFLFYLNDSSKINLSYNNTISVRYDWDTKTAMLDTLKLARPSLRSPFYIKVKELLKYAIKNMDSIKCQVNELKDTLQFTFVIKNKLAEFSNKIPSIFSKEGAVSTYIIWTNKDLMPFRLKRKLPHQTSIEEVIKVYDYTCADIVDKQIGVYLPKGFSVLNKQGDKIMTTELEGKVAPSWSLKNLEEKSILLSDYKGKNLLIEFTGVGCGPCHLALPFLSRFKSEYKDKNFNVLSIESFSDNISGLKRYKDLNHITFEFLIADKVTVTNYKILAVPVFILVNKIGVIEKVFIGYETGETDKKIMVYANKM
jgi:thiol-disulfide isomerase/thioredoxin